MMRHVSTQALVMIAMVCGGLGVGLSLSAIFISLLR